MTDAALRMLEELHRIIDDGGARLEVRAACEVADGAERFPVYVISLGNPDPAVGALGVVGGVHGLERVGTQVVLSFLASVVERLGRDRALEQRLERLRLVFMPLVNPAGMSRGTRANANGVDLMRNAPLESRENAAPLVGGQRLSPRLPWYRGTGLMERESRALCDVVRAELLSRRFAIALDCRSGFGLRDRIWFPHAHTRAPFARAPEVHALMELFGKTWPDHPYLFEPQSRRYLAHGDLWDFLCAEPRGGGTVFLPLTLEMGSWRWVRKSPRQLLSVLGMFNPMPPDRLERVRRNHLAWFDFLCRAACDHAEWLPAGAERERHERAARAEWFEGT